MIVATAFEDVEAVAAALHAGALACISREGSTDRAVAAVHSANDGHGLVEREVVTGLVVRYEARLAEACRRDRAVIESLAAAVEVKDMVTHRHQRAVSRLAVEVGRLVEPELATPSSSGRCSTTSARSACRRRSCPSRGRSPTRSGSSCGCTRRPAGHPAARPGVRRQRCRALPPRALGRRRLPAGHGGKSIPMAARIFSVCDALEAMTANRPYRSAMSPEVAVQRITLESGAQFDPRIVGALERGLEEGLINLDDVLDGASAFPAPPRISTGPRW